MTQFKAILERLKNPTVILSIISQIASILISLNVDVNVNLVTGIAISICSILAILGIMSDPDTKNKGYGDDILTCSNCNAETVHTDVAGNMVCKICGTTHIN